MNISLILELIVKNIFIFISTLFLGVLLVGCFDQDTNNNQVTSGTNLKVTNLVSHSDTKIGKKDSLLIPFDVIKDSIYTINVYNSSHKVHSSYKVKIWDENDSAICPSPYDEGEFYGIIAKSTTQYTLCVKISYLDSNSTTSTPTVEINKVGSVKNRLDGLWYLTVAEGDLANYTSYRVASNPQEASYIARIYGDSITQYVSVYSGDSVYVDSSLMLLAENWLFKESYLKHYLNNEDLTFDYLIEGNNVTSSGKYQFKQGTFDVKTAMLINHDSPAPDELQGRWYLSRSVEAELVEDSTGNYSLNEEIDSVSDDSEIHMIWKITEDSLKRYYVDEDTIINTFSLPAKKAFWNRKYFLIEQNDDNVQLKTISPIGAEVIEIKKYSGPIVIP